MRVRKAFLILKKEWREIKRSPGILLPAIIVCIMFSVIFPLVILNLPGKVFPLEMYTKYLVKNLPVDLQQRLASMSDQEIFVHLVSIFYMPIFLLIPLAPASIIAADSFAGEKERGTIEALLSSPITALELFLGKVFAAFIVAVMMGWIGGGVFIIIFDIFTFKALGYFLLPNLVWLIVLVGLLPLVALLSTTLTVFISFKAKGVREAQSISGVSVVPFIFLCIAQIVGLIFFNERFVICLMIIITVIAIILIYMCGKKFKSDKILTRL